jgi:hypothetical protein
LATGVIAALAIAAPVAQASAATSLEVSGAGVAKAGTVVGDTFNGGTTVVVSTSAADATTLDSP